jgi:hypothetical protein
MKDREQLLGQLMKATHELEGLRVSLDAAEKAYRECLLGPWSKALADLREYEANSAKKEE